jgi:hypothetical protein
MEAIHLVLVAIVAAIGGALAMSFFGRDRRVARALSAAPLVKIAEAKHGDVVRVTGKLVHGTATLEAPFSHRECAHYDALLEERWLDHGKEEWGTIAHEVSSRSFVVTDDTGSATVDTTRFEAFVTKDHHKAKGELDRAKAQAFIAKHGQKNEIAADHVLRYQEGVLEAGETVTVLGQVHHEEHDGKKVVMIRATDSAPVRASDDPDLVAK